MTDDSTDTQRSVLVEYAQERLADWQRHLDTIAAYELQMVEHDRERLLDEARD